MTASKRFQILICDGPSCGVCHGSEELKEKIETRLDTDSEMGERVSVIDFTCFGRCEEGPNLFVRELAEGEDGEEEPDFGELDGKKGFYVEVDDEKLERVLEEHCRQGTPIVGLAEEY